MTRMFLSTALASVSAMLLAPLVLSVGQPLRAELPVPVAASATAGILAGQA